jgi:hypothetical protein
MTEQGLERLKIDRLHVTARALELSPAAVQQHFKHIWDPIDDLSRQLRILPAGLVRLWLDQPGGHVVITHMPSRYEPGTQTLKRQVLRNVAYVRLSDLATVPLEALVPVGRLLDHLLGSGGATEEPWLSQGGGVNLSLREVGRRVGALFPLGYGFDQAACVDVRSYFARSLALYLHDRRALNVADPQIERLLRTTILSNAFWRSRKIQKQGN